MSPSITHHANKRLKSRAGLRGEEGKKVADRALRRGITHAEARGGLNRYMSALYLRHRNANNIRVYGRFVYIFKHKRLITVMHLPEEFWPVADEIMRDKRKAEA